MGRPDPAGLTKPLGRIEGDRSKILGDEYAILPFPLLRAKSQFAFADTPPGPDGIRREVPVVVRVGKDVYPTLGLASVLAYLKVDPADVLIRLGDAVQFSAGDKLWRIPISERGTYYLNYRYDATEDGTQFVTAEYLVLMSALHAKYVEHDTKREVPDLKDRILLVGEVVAGKADSGPTPLGAYSPLVLMHANFIENVLNGDFVRHWPDWAVCLVLGAFSYLGYYWMLRRDALVMAALAVAGVALYVGVACVLWIGWSVWLPIIGPMIGLVALDFEAIIQRIRHEQLAKEKVKAQFQTYLPPALLNQLMKDGGSLEVKSERKPVTVLFSDLREFTSWSERVPEAELISQLNEYLAAMVDCIDAERGTLHKFIGDAVMAAWGDFVSEGPAADAERALVAAFAMQSRLVELNVKWAAEGRHQLKMGIGLNHGNVLVGNVGSPRKLEFTLIGDAVNLAARFESLTKEYGAQILVGESIKDLLGEKFDFRPLGSIPVKGKLKLISVFDVHRR